MSMVSFAADGVARNGYLALPPRGSGRGVLALHPWWGLTNFFKSTCERLAAQGYVAFAPDLHHGKIAASIDEANQILETRDFPATQATAEAALHFLQNHPRVQGDKLGALGFSMGAAFSLLLDSVYPNSFAGIVLFYGASEADVSGSQARFQFHFGEDDDWEPLDNVRKITAANAEVHVYPGAGHWFFEDDRPEHFKAEAAQRAWARTLEFFDRTLPE
jgi:carboxymethylenebutenolidase